MNKFKNYVWMAAGFAVLAAVISATTAGPAIAALVKAALVQSIDEPARNPYQQSVLFSQDALHCTNFVCTVTFNQVPLGFRLAITHASARFALGNGGQDANVRLGIVASGGAEVDLPAPVRIFSGLPDSYVASSPITYYVEPGQTPKLSMEGQFVVANGSITSSAAIVGHLVAIP